jgi:hypothetical protein
VRGFLILRTGLKTDPSAVRLRVGKHRSSFLGSSALAAHEPANCAKYDAQRVLSSLQKARYRCLEVVKFCKCASLRGRQLDTDFIHIFNGLVDYRRPFAALTCVANVAAGCCALI